MSGPLRFRTAAALILAGLSTSPASANIIDTLLNRAPEEAAAPAPAKDAPAEDQCLSRPGKPADGQHWMYRLDGHRRCWFLVPEETATVRQRAHHTAVKRRPASKEEDEVTPRKRKAVVDARAELMRPAPEETLQPRPVPAVKVVDADASVPATGAAALVPPPPVLASPDQRTPDQPKAADPDPRQDSQDNVETLLAATPADSETVAVSAPSATPVAVPFATGDNARWWTSKWFGPLLMALGLISLLIAMRPLLPRSVRAPEPEDRLNPLLESDSQTHLQHLRQATPMRPGARQIAGHQRRSRPSAAGNPGMTYQEAIRLLAEFDSASVEARPGALTPRRLDAAPVSGKATAYVSRVS
jgi:hypothetical protein